MLGAGSHQLAVGAIAAAMGGNIRVGMEDSLWAGPGKEAVSNAEQVRMARSWRGWDSRSRRRQKRARSSSSRAATRWRSDGHRHGQPGRALRSLGTHRPRHRSLLRYRPRDRRASGARRRDRRDQLPARRPARPGAGRRINAEEGRAIAAPGDVSRTDDAERMVADAIERLGRLDLLVNNAGTAATKRRIEPAELDLLTDDLWQALVDTNLVSIVRCTRRAASALAAAGGAVVNTASLSGYDSVGSSMAYAATKAGVINLTKNIARGLSPQVRVNAVDVAAPLPIRNGSGSPLRPIAYCPAEA